MTQKELLYVEDAIGHEGNIIKICQDAVTKLEDESLVKFMEDEINRHKSTKEKLMNMLEAKANE